MKNRRGSRHSLPTTQKLTIIAQDPSVRRNGRILTAQVEVPAEELLPGPCGYRIHVIDYDATATTWSMTLPRARKSSESGCLSTTRIQKRESLGKVTAADFNRALIENPEIPQRRTFTRSPCRFLHVSNLRSAGAARGDPTATSCTLLRMPSPRQMPFIPSEDRGLFFGYFAQSNGKPIYTCLSHDVVAHETTHALLDGIRPKKFSGAVLARPSRVS